MILNFGMVRMAQAQASEGFRAARCRRWVLGLAIALIGLAVPFALFVHPFLAINVPVKANVLVIEGWVPGYVVDRAVGEMNRGRYDAVFISGMQTEDGKPSDAEEIAGRLAKSGIDPARIVAAPAPPKVWDRTSHMARAVRDRLFAGSVKPRGVNVITLGPHARQSLLAYSRMIGPGIPVGVISVPKDDYDPDLWWASAAGIRKTTKDFAGWLKEWVFFYKMVNFI